MLRHDEASRVVTLENGSLRVILDYGGGLIFKEFSNLMSGEKANEDREAFVIGIRGSDYGSADFSVTKVETVCDRVQELISVTAELPDEMIKVRLSLIGDEDSVTVLYQVWDDYKLGVPTVATMKVPLVARLEASREDGAKYYYPSGVRIGKNGEDVMKPMMEAFHSAD
ncbi:MAG: hypothetical protein LBU13_05410, partial [Synergistaceae bacterium]|nr:hypothetical protein [Synergistaceae bacterium]